MWFATEYGLIKYDGKNLEHFKSIPKDPSSLAGDIIHTLAEDQDGNIWAGNRHSGLHRFDARNATFTHFAHEPLDSSSLPNNWITNTLVDSHNALWVATRGGGLRLLEPGSDRFRFPILPDSPNIQLQSDFVNELATEDSTHLWIATNQSVEHWRIVRKNPTYLERVKSYKEESLEFKALLTDRQGRLWVGTRNSGLYHLQRATGILTPIPLPLKNERINVTHIWQIMEDRAGNFWVATDGGLFYLEEDPTKTYPSFVVSKFMLAPVRRALSLYESRDGVIWIGTNSGVIILTPRYNPFYRCEAIPANNLPAKTRGIMTIDQDGDGDIWVGTTSGLFQFDPDRRLLHQDFLPKHPELHFLDSSNIIAIRADNRNDIWFATVVDFNVAFQVLRYEKNTGRFMDYSDRHPLFKTHNTLDITEGPNGNLWFSNAGGLVHFLVAQDSIYVHQREAGNVQSIGSNNINTVLYDEEHILWIGTDDSGLDRLDLNTGDFKHYPPLMDDLQSISSKRVKYLLKGDNDRLWLGTAGGVNLFDPDNETFRSYTTTQGLQENLVKSMIQDRQGNIWLATPHWLSRLEPQAGHIVNFGLKDGIQIDEFQSRKSFMDDQGRLYFGANNGLISFHPDSIRPNPYFPPVVLTDLWVMNKRVSPGTNRDILPEHINFAKKITLHPRENVFTFHFAALSYINPQKNTYAYQLEGFDADWQMVGPRSEATYTNLPHGKYTFKVKAANNDGTWNNKGTSIQLIILPPWYRTWWSYVLFASFALLLLGSLYRFHLNRRLQMVENVRLKELDAVKSRFFANISHEFRTPVTIILGLADQLKTQVSEGAKNGLDIIQRNGHQLLFLVSQLLDLSRLESGSLQLQLRQDDIVAFLKYLLESFHSYATEKEVNLSFKTELGSLNMSFDPERLQQIMSNLLSNAIKYTPAGGQVGVTLLSRMSALEIKVRDTGIGISAEDMPHIFDRFFRSNHLRQQPVDGAGLGLALTKELVKLMNGDIEVKSALGKGTTFTVFLPLDLVANEVSQHSDEEIDQKRTTYLQYLSRTLALERMKEIRRPDEKVRSKTMGEDTPLLLIIEDNVDMLGYLISCLNDLCQIEVAYNGREGMEKAIKIIPDLIISDVMMPEMDGFEVSRQLKSNSLTSHIPIILLTAKADADSKMLGLRQGVEAYLTKPFYKKELLIRVQAILERRKRLQAYYSSLAGLAGRPADDIAPEEAPDENPFLEKLRSIVEKNLADQNFNVPQLCQSMGISHPQLHRKMKALTGLSIGQYIRSIRIGKAKSMLLEKKNWTIAAVAYEVGFADPDYFSKVFKSEAGVTPSQFRGE